MTPFSTVSRTRVDASCTNVFAEALDQPDTFDDSEIDDRRDKFMDGRVPPCDPPANIFTHKFYKIYVFLITTTCNTVFTLTGFIWNIQDKIIRDAFRFFESMKRKIRKKQIKS